MGAILTIFDAVLRLHAKDEVSALALVLNGTEHIRVHLRYNQDPETGETFPVFAVDERRLLQQLEVQSQDLLAKELDEVDNMAHSPNKALVSPSHSQGSGKYDYVYDYVYDYDYDCE